MQRFRETETPSGEDVSAKTAEMNAVDMKSERLIASLSQAKPGITPSGITAIARAVETAVDHYAQTYAGQQLRLSSSSVEKVHNAADAIYSAAGAENTQDAELLVLHTQQRIEQLIEQAARSAARVGHDPAQPGASRSR